MAKRITHLPNATSPTETDYLGMDNTSNGARKILVSALAEYILNHAEISDIGDVSLSNLTNGQVIKWNATTEKWENADESGGGGGSGNVDDVYVNGVSVLDSQHIAQIKSYKEVTQAEYDALPASKLTDGIMYCITDSDFSASDVPYDNTDSGLSSDNTQGAIDELASNLLIQKSIENTDIATFTDGSNLPMPKLQVGIEPQQDLHGYDGPWVGGAGKNKFDYDTVYTSYKQSDGSFRLTANNAVSIKNYIPQGLVNKQLTFSVYVDLSKETSPNYIRTVAEVGGSIVMGTDVSSGNKGYISVIFTPTSTDDNFYLTYGSSGNNYFTMKDLMIEVSSARTSFAPYSNICPISGWDECNVVRTGKNLCKSTVHGYVSSSDDLIVIDNDTESVIFYAYEGQTYTISSSATMNKSRVALVGTDNVVNYTPILQREILSDNVNTWTATWTGWTVWYKCSSRQTAFDNSAQVEFGSTATTYEPYNGQTYDVEFTDGDNPLTVYGGTLDVVSGVLAVDKKSVTLNGSEGWMISGATINNQYYLAVDDVPRSNDLIGIICDRLTEITGSQGYNSKTINGVSTWNDANVGQLRVSLDVSIVDRDVSGFKTWLSNNPLTVVYPLATPTTIQLTPTQVKSLLGSNNVWADTGKVIKLEYLANATDVIASLDARITALENA